MKKKVNVFGKSIPVLAIFVLGIALVSAALVPYLSNTITGNVDVSSPITITVNSVSTGSHDDNTYTVSIYGGESFTVDAKTEIHINGLTGHIAENKIVGMTNSEGLTIEYRVDAYPGVFQIPVCTTDTDAYFYIGDPTEPLDAGAFDSVTTFNAALNLDPTEDLVVETKVILAGSAACTIPEPVFVADIL